MMIKPPGFILTREGEITDNYLDFMTMIQNMNKKQENEKNKRH